MATKTVTIDTTDAGSRGGEMVYIDRFGSPHTVTNAQAFTMELTDNSATDVRYSVDEEQTMTTMDGLTIDFYRNADGGNNVREMRYRDAYQNGTPDYQVPGEISVICPVSGIIQNWKVSIADINDVDSPTAITRWRLEDQFGNVMDLPTDDAGAITVS